VITDVRMPGGSGLDLLETLRGKYPRLPVVVATAYGSMDVAATAVARGAADFLPKPFDLDRTLAVVERALGRSSLAVEVEPGREVEPALIGSSMAMQEVFRRIAMAATGDLQVLITGPSGSGKELAARLLHRHSNRASGPFVAVNCGAIGVASAERDLFGSADGFPGLFGSATGGTLLLDEVGDLPTQVQGSLLRVIDERRVRSQGSLEGKPFDLRIIAASNRDLEKDPSFRRDLLFRLTGATVAMPALIDHLEDLPLIAGHLLSRCSTRTGRKLAMTEPAMTALRSHAWPGNVRELRQVIEEGALVATAGVIDAAHLRISPVAMPSPAVGEARREIADLLEQQPGAVHRLWIDRAEKLLFGMVLERTRGNQVKAADLLGIHRSTLRKRALELGLIASRDGDDDSVA
jgi:DNA-binding NtrC family response regulator